MGKRKTTCSILKKAQGLSMVAVMVATGMIGGLSVTITHIIKQINEGKKETEGIQGQFQLQKEISFLLADRHHCTISLAGENPAVNPVTFKKADIDEDNEGLDVKLFTSNRAGNARSQNPKFSPGTKFGKWTIKSLKLQLNAATGAHTPNKENRDLGKLVVHIKKKSKEKSHHKTLRFPLRVKVATGGGANPDSTLLECQAPFSATSGLAKIIETSNGILIQDTLQVGTDPSLPCDTSAKRNIRFNPSANSRLEYCNGTNWQQIGIPTAMSSSSDGININGSLRVGRSTAVCSGSNKGTLRYNETSNQIEFCNAVQWTVP